MYHLLAGALLSLYDTRMGLNSHDKCLVVVVVVVDEKKMRMMKNCSHLMREKKTQSIMKIDIITESISQSADES
jgi:hypothetical protein